jgi:dTDP-4-dehydrorhamnose reductase
MITGAAGMLGQAVVRAAGRAGEEVHACSRAELDITDEAAVAEAVRRLAPDTVVNLAAWTDVDGAESDPGGAFAVNGAGAGHVALAAAAVGARVVHVSTDYVFDGAAGEPYVESDATGPRSVYGASKLEGEQRVAAAGAPFAIVRTSWLFGAGGGNFVDTMLRLAGEGRSELRVVDDQVGCPTWTGHLAPAMLELVRTRAEGILHVAAAGHCSWNGLAREVFAQAGLDVRVLPQSTADSRRPAPRPANSVLLSERPQAPRLPDWREGVRGHLAAVSVGGGAR